MTDSELLQAIYNGMQSMDTEIQSMKSEIQMIKTETQSVKTEMQSMKAQMQSMDIEIQSIKAEIQSMKTEIKDMNKRLTSLELHIENSTDSNLKLLAENHVELIKKLQQAIPVADKSLAYEVKVNYLLDRVEKIEREISEIKEKIG